MIAREAWGAPIAGLGMAPDVVAGFVVLLTIGLNIPILRTFFEIGEPTLAQWAVIAGIVTVGIVMLLAVRRTPWLRRLEDPPMPDDDLTPIAQQSELSSPHRS